MDRQVSKSNPWKIKLFFLQNNLGVRVDLVLWSQSLIISVGVKAYQVISNSECHVDDVFGSYTAREEVGQSKIKKKRVPTMVFPKCVLSGKD